MGNSRNSNQVCESRRSQTASNSTTKSRSTQKNLETMKVLSNIVIPNIHIQEGQLQSWIPNGTHPIPSTSQHPDYVMEMCQNRWQQQSGTAPDTICADTSLPVDIVKQALSEVINEGSQQNYQASNEVIVDIIEQMSPWSEKDFIISANSTVTSSNKKDKGVKCAKRSRRPTDKGVSKKQKIRDVIQKPNTQPSELKQLLEGTSSPIIIPDECEDRTEISIFSQPSEMAIIREAITLKKKLTKEKEQLDGEFSKTQQGTNGLREEITRLNEQLIVESERLKDIGYRRDVVSNKLDWIKQSLG